MEVAISTVCVFGDKDLLKGVCLLSLSLSLYLALFFSLSFLFFQIFFFLWR